MAGLANDYLIYPILDLIRDEMRKSNVTNISAGSDPFAGTPSVSLWRDHPLDVDKVTGADMFYESGYKVELYLTFGTTDVSDIPPEIEPTHPDYDFYRYHRLTRVTTLALSPDFTPLYTYNISLNYNDKGLLTGTTVNRI